MRLSIARLRQAIRDVLVETEIVANPQDIDKMSSEELDDLVAKSKKGKVSTTQPLDGNNEFTSKMSVAMKRYSEYLQKNPRVKDPIMQRELMKYFIDQVFGKQPKRFGKF